MDLRHALTNMTAREISHAFGGRRFIYAFVGNWTNPSISIKTIDPDPSISGDSLDVIYAPYLLSGNKTTIEIERNQVLLHDEEQQLYDIIYDWIYERTAISFDIQDDYFNYKETSNPFKKAKIVWGGLLSSDEMEQHAISDAFIAWREEDTVCLRQTYHCTDRGRECFIVENLFGEDASLFYDWETADHFAADMYQEQEIEELCRWIIDQIILIYEQ